MAKWQPTIIINEHIAQELIEQQCALPVSSIEVLGEGWDNIAYLINDAHVFRFPRREFGVMALENEIALVPYIAKHISFTISAPEWIGKPSDVYPSHFAGYKMVPGHSVCEVTAALISNKYFAAQLAEWLKELHAIPVVEQHLSALKGDQSWRLNVPVRIASAKENINTYEHYFTAAGFNKDELCAVLDTYKEIIFSNSKKAYVHGDLYCRHVMVTDDLKLTGFIDFGDVHIGHPGIDLSVGIGLFAPDALEVFFATYGADNDTKHAAAFRALCHSISLLPYAYEKDIISLKIWSKLSLERAITVTGQLFI